MNYLNMMLFLFKMKLGHTRTFPSCYLIVVRFYHAPLFHLVSLVFYIWTFRIVPVVRDEDIDTDKMLEFTRKAINDKLSTDEMKMIIKG